MREFGLFLSVVLLNVTTNVFAQCRYCNTYDEFRADQWTVLDTVYCIGHSKSSQFWWGVNDYKLTTGDEATDKILKKEAFLVMIGDTMYVNLRNLQFEKTRFGSGYTIATLIGKDTLLFVNRQIGKYMKQRVNVGMMFGAIGGAIAASSMMKQQVCYAISNGAGEKGRIPVQLINDNMIDKMIANRSDLREDYYSEKNDNKRIRANHVIPILEKAGIIVTDDKQMNTGLCSND